MAAQVYCAQSSLQAGEALAGTAAADTDQWIILEVPEPWAAKPLESSVLDNCREIVESWLAALPRARLQLVRRPQEDDGRRTLFLASSSPGDPWLVSLSVPGMEALGELNVPELFSQRGGPEATAVSRLYLVCTHGKRDLCCAKWGMGLFCAALEVEPERVWQTSHLGGHRFAATALSLPSGICYGRMEEGDAERWLAAEAKDELFDLDRVRGRTSHSKPAQAAELCARKELGLAGFADVRIEGCEPGEHETWTVQAAIAGGRRLTIDIEVESAGVGLSSCGDEPREARNFRCRVRR